MRKLVVTENITVDGVIDMAAGWFDPLAKDVDQSDIIATNAEHSAAADALLVGRNTSRHSETSGRSKPAIRPVSPTISTASTRTWSLAQLATRAGRTPLSCAVTSSRRCER